MPDATLARPPLARALDEGLAAMFRGLQAEPAPAPLIELANQLEDAWRRSRIAAEARAIA